MGELKFKKLYFLGPEGTYAQMAMNIMKDTLNIFCDKIVPKNPITSVIKAVDSEIDSAAVLPIENSIEGIVRETIDNLVVMKDENIKITAETIVPIHHCLASVSDNIDTIKTVISHPQALDQCSGYINKNLPNANVISSPSTGEAAKFVKEKGVEYASISSEIAAEKFGLNILETNINDVKDNKTRFILISRFSPKPSEHDKTSLFFSVKNEPGSLYNVLKIFYEHGINMLYIESRPSKKLMGEYNFCVDIEGSQYDDNIIAAISEIKKNTNILKISGSYPKFQQ